MRVSLRGLVIATLAVLVLPTAVLAKPVERFVLDAAEDSGIVTEILSEACGVPLEATLSGHVIVTIYEDAGGNVSHEIDRYSTRFVVLNPATGETLRFTDAGPDQFRYDHESGTITFSLIGRSATGAANAGKYTILMDLDGNIITDPVSVAGNDLGDWVANVCAALV